MPPKKRFKTKYPGVYYIEGISVGSGKRERIYYIRYRRGGKEFDEKCGRQFQDDMTPAKAARIRVEKIDGKKQSNTEKRHEIRDQKEEEQKKWTIDRLKNGPAPSVGVNGCVPLAHGHVFEACPAE